MGAVALVEEYRHRWTSRHSGDAGWPVAIDERCLAAKLFQGVVTPIVRVGPFATGVKILDRRKSVLTA